MRRWCDHCMEYLESGATEARSQPNYIRHLRQIMVVPTPSCEQISNSSIRRFAPGKPMPHAARGAIAILHDQIDVRDTRPLIFTDHLDPFSAATLDLTDSHCASACVEEDVARQFAHSSGDACLINCAKAQLISRYHWASVRAMTISRSLRMTAALPCAITTLLDLTLQGRQALFKIQRR